jgi:tetratricopeptide (TPR) repeat protein
MRDNKPQVARDLVSKALTADANNAELQILAASLDVADGKLPDAKSKIEKLDERKPPLPPLLGAKLFVVKGQLAEKEGRTDDAIAAYTDGAKLAGELDLTPTMAAVTKLTDLSKKETDPAKSADYKSRADKLLSALEERAKEDGELSLTLGVAYLQAGDAAKAEENLRRANTLREKDPETKLQLAKSLSAQGKTADAISQLEEALSIDPKRIDVQLELARTYQDSGQDTQAIAEYEKLLADPAVPIVVRAKAGKYFATKGELEKASKQAEPILKAEPDNAAGLYLKAEGLMRQNKWDEARPVLQKATTIDEFDAQYLDALGRAFEGSYVASNDSKFIDSARYAYERATKADPKMFHPWLGLGHMLVESSKSEPAIDALRQASALDSSNREVDYWMGLAYFGVRKQGDAQRKAAAVWLEAALKGDSKLSDELRADGYWRLGQIYDELNKASNAAAAMEHATHIGEEIEKQTGKSPPWLTNLYYRLGDIYNLQNNKPAQKRAWQRFIDRKPPAGSMEKKTAERALLTELKGY